jgi:class 3 adenylate cyclase/tetratricopeptide (TPR) repeat protein
MVAASGSSEPVREERKVAGRGAAVSCPTCGGVSHGAARFCASCGAPLGQASCIAPAAAGERKVVTVLFADIQGSLALIRDRDPEEAQELLDGVVAILAECTHRFGGTVCQNLGDGIMAVFGAPLAQEDHPDRACHAAIAMLQELASRRTDRSTSSDPIARIGIRVGIASGEVVVRAIASDLTLHYTAVGTTVHLASRLQSLAACDSICVAAETRRLLKRGFPLQRLAPLAVAGLPEPVAAFRLEHEAGAVRSSQPASAPAPMPIHLVGRRDELALLRSAHRASDGGQGRSVAVVGEAGIGKSRLVGEFLKGLEGASCRLLCTGGATYGAGTPWLPMASLLRELFRLQAGAARVALERGLEDLGLAADELAVPLLGCLDLLESDGAWAALSPGARRERIRAALDAVLARIAADRGMVLVVEDLHDVDRETLAFLDALAGHAPGRRMLLLVTARPPLEPLWAAPTARIDLAPLPWAQAEEFAVALLGSDPSLRAMTRQLVRRTGGNPFFLQESVRELAETGRLEGQPSAYRLAGGGQLPLPASVQATLAARIDRLPVADREVLRAAAAIGEKPERSLLEAVAGHVGPELDACLGRLTSLGFLAEARAGHRFCHALTREAAYAGMLQRRRRSLHREIVAAIQRARSVKAGASEWLAGLARHALAGELWETAFTAFRDLAQRAMARSAWTEALSAAAEAQQALAHLPIDAENGRNGIDLRFLQADARFALGHHDRLRAEIDLALRTADEIGDRRRAVQGLTRKAISHWMHGELLENLACIEQARAVADADGDPDLKINTTLRHAMALQAHGDYRATLKPFSELLRAIPESRHGDLYGLTILAAVVCRAAFARSLGEVGGFADGRALAAEGIAMARERRHPFTRVYAAREVGVFHLLAGDPEAAIDVLKEGRRLALKVHADLLCPATTAALGCALVRVGRRDHGTAMLHEALELSERIGLLVRRSQTLCWLAEACLEAGDVPAAERHVAEGLACARNHYERANEGWLLAMASRIAGHPHSRRTALRRQYAQAALALADKLGLATLRAWCERDMADAGEGRTASSHPGATPLSRMAV